MINDQISQSMGVRSLAETQAEDITEPHENVGSLRRLGSSGEQSQTDENRQQSAQVLAKPKLEKTSQAEGSSSQENNLQTVGEQVLTPATTNDDENLTDLELARSNVQNIISLGDDAVKEMVEIAKQSESPRAFEVVSTLMKTLLDANKEFVDISSKKKLVKDEEKYGRPETNVTNNNLIVSTADKR
jgi:citrate synthase